MLPSDSKFTAYLTQCFGLPGTSPPAKRISPTTHLLGWTRLAAPRHTQLPCKNACRRSLEGPYTHKDVLPGPVLLQRSRSFYFLQPLGACSDFCELVASG